MTKPVRDAFVFALSSRFQGRAHSIFRAKSNQWLGFNALRRDYSQSPFLSDGGNYQYPFRPRKGLADALSRARSKRKIKQTSET